MKEKKKIESKEKKDASTIEEVFVTGDIFGTLEKMGIDPTASDKRVGEYISIMLEDDDLKYAFAKACERQKESPKTMVKKIIKSWLRNKGYL
jgi:hypothetical protein